MKHKIFNVYRYLHNTRTACSCQVVFNVYRKIFYVLCSFIMEPICRGRRPRRPAVHRMCLRRTCGPSRTPAPTPEHKKSLRDLRQGVPQGYLFHCVVTPSCVPAIGRNSVGRPDFRPPHFSIMPPKAAYRNFSLFSLISSLQKAPGCTVRRFLFFTSSPVRSSR